MSERPDTPGISTGGSENGWAAELRSRLARLRLDPAREAEIVEELSEHLDARYEELRAAGEQEEDARRQALEDLREPGALAGHMRSLRQARVPPPIAPGTPPTGFVLRDACQDLRYATRLIYKQPGFAAAAVLTLALGIGATSAIFSVVQAVMLHPLPYANPDRIVTIWETNRGGESRNVIAPANFVEWTERSRTLEHLGMVEGAGLVVLLDGHAIRTAGLRVSSGVFHAIGVLPALGRAYTPEEDGGDAVIVLTDQFWQRHLGGRQDVLGLTLSTADGPRTVVGVMPAGFTMLGQRADFLIPYGMTAADLRAYRGRGNSYAIARLRDDVSFEQAGAEMRGIFAQLEKEAPDRNATRTVMLFHPQEQMVGEVRPALRALMAAVALVLLIACVNVANLLLARSATREREVATRAALGAGRGRLIRQLLAESLVLAAAGGLAGLGVAALCHRGLLALVRDRIPVPRIDQAALDGSVVLFTLVTALAAGIVFGVVPAFVSTARPRDGLRDSGRHGGGQRLRRALSVLVVGEVALSLVLLTGAGLLMRGVLTLQRVEPGFRAEGVLTAVVSLPSARYELPAAERTLGELGARLAVLPGVEHVGGASCMPVPFPCIGTSFWRVDRPKPPDAQVPSSHVRPITPGYFRAMSIAHRAGRDFSAIDREDSPPVAIVSQELVRQQFPGEEPLGKRLRVNFNHANGRDDMEWTIVGVVGDTRSSLDGPVRQTIYVPRSQRPGTGLTFFLRTAGEGDSLGTSVMNVVRSIEPEAPVTLRPLEDWVGGTIARPRALSALVGAFALAALALAAIGVYGVMSYSVRARTQEIGLRLALGASAPGVGRLVLAQSLRLVGAGVLVGAAAAGALSRLLEQFLFGVDPLDPWTFALTPLALIAVAVVASYLPARRAMRMAPLDALRTS